MLEIQCSYFKIRVKIKGMYVIMYKNKITDLKMSKKVKS